MKKLGCILLAGTFAISLLAACGTKDAAKQKQNEVQQQEMQQEMLQNGEAQPGAQFERSTTPEGEAMVTYQNPDGSGGGGVALD